MNCNCIDCGKDIATTADELAYFDSDRCADCLRDLKQALSEPLIEVIEVEAF